jgi:hypothetical protein
MPVQNAEGSILQIFETLRKCQTEDMSLIQVELRQLSFELSRIRECQDKLLQIWDNSKLESSRSRRGKHSLINSQMHQSSSGPKYSNDKTVKSAESILDSSIRANSDKSGTVEHSITRQPRPENIFPHVETPGEHPFPQSLGMEHSVPPQPSPVIIYSPAETPGPHPQLPTHEPAAGEGLVVTATLEQTDSIRFSSTGCTRTEAIQTHRVPVPHSKKKQSRLQYFATRGHRLLFTAGPAPAMESSVETIFDGQLPRQRTVRKRILTCFGACSEGSSINGLWRRFLLAVFGIQDDEVWTRRVGSAVIHPESHFARGKRSGMESEKEVVVDPPLPGQCLAACLRSRGFARLARQSGNPSVVGVGDGMQ